jgi:S1-C subfamily serine protease
MSLWKKLAAWKRGGGIITLAVMAAVLLLVSGCGTAAPGAAVTPAPPLNLPSSSSAVQVAPLFDEGAVISLYEKCIPAVVQVESVASVPAPFLTPFGLDIPKMRGQGSGFIIDAEGHILTNSHVVDKVATVKVFLSDGTQLEGKVIGTDRNNDIALLQVDPAKIPGLAYLVLADSREVKPGQMAVALGSPFGLQGSITVGIVSGIGRSIPGSSSRNMIGIIQTDAAINPGNSGGPLLNSHGEVIGINTAIEASANGVGFAVPIDTAKKILPELLRGGSVKTPWLGIEGMPVSKDLVDKLKLKVEKGVYVVGVMAGSPAERAGILESGRNKQNEPTAGGDIITAIDSTPVTRVEDMLAYFNGKKPGDKVTLSVQRADEMISLPVELGEWPEQLPGYDVPAPAPGEGGNQFDFGPFHFRMK